MDFQVDVWLRGENHATTHTVAGIERTPDAWTDDDVRNVLTEMLRAMNRQKSPSAGDSFVALRGLSWIVNPYETGGVVIAIEITLGAAIAGPFQVGQQNLESRIARVLQEVARGTPGTPSDVRIH